MGPLIEALSLKKGRFTYGEGGRHVYSILIGGHGTPVAPGKILHVRTKLWFTNTGVVTRPFSFDVCYWTIGIDPTYDYAAHFKLFLKNLSEIVSQSRWLLAIYRVGDISNFSGLVSNRFLQANKSLHHVCCRGNLRHISLCPNIYGTQMWRRSCFWDQSA